VMLVCCTTGNSRSNEEWEMRRASVSVQKGIHTYLEDLTLCENVEPRNSGAHRRR
jgi:hypothetical protein